MIQPINWHITIPLLYIAGIIYTVVYVAIKHEDLHALIVMVAACFWPLYYMTEILIFIFEDHDDKQLYNQIKRKNNFLNSAEGKVLIKKNNLSPSDINRIRKGRVVRVKKVNGKVR